MNATRQTDDPRYPIGRFGWPKQHDAGSRARAIASIAALPEHLTHAVRGLTHEQLELPYRDGGWTVRQVVHHVADSHVNAYVRTRLLLTEREPTVKPYDENAWAQLADARHAAIGGSLLLLTAVHERWVHCLRALPASAFARTLQHPENGPMTLDDLVELYAWHGRHHAAHVFALRERLGI